MEALAVSTLAVDMIEAAGFTALMEQVGRAVMQAAEAVTAVGAAIGLTAIAMSADEEGGPAIWITALEAE